MPFTIFHMGPGIFIKALLQSSFSLMVFGWAQLLMDIQPLVVMLTGAGQLHGFSHTYIGAGLIALFAALTAKYLSEVGLYLLGFNSQWQLNIAWRVALLSAFIGSYSHVVLDSIMHADVKPFAPFNTANDLLGLISISAMHEICVYSGVVGAVIYYGLSAWQKKRLNKLKP